MKIGTVAEHSLIYIGYDGFFNSAQTESWAKGSILY